MSEEDARVASAIEQIRDHLYTALNCGDDGDAIAHVSRAYRLAAAEQEGEADQKNDTGSDHLEGSFIARDLYPDYDELHRRVREHASERFEHPELDTSPEAFDIRYVGLEDGVVLYKVDHPVLDPAPEGVTVDG